MFELEYIGKWSVRKLHILPTSTYSHLEPMYQNQMIIPLTAYYQKIKPSHWTRCVVFTDPDLLIGRDILFGQNLAC